MILLLAWLLAVCAVYFRQSDSLFEYVFFLFQHHGSFTLWHAYSLKALGAVAVAVWVAWVATKCGKRLLNKIGPALEMTRLEEVVFAAALGFALIALVTFVFGVLHLWYAAVFWAVVILATPLLSRGGVSRGVGQENQSIDQHHPGASRHPSSAEEGSCVR